jgi:3D-(3,5/4)-trihydroxycyclohexane-1,2-dione acylhydrolase (decyclizing)
VKLAAPDLDVYVLVGDGSYLMMPGELVTAVQERLKIIVVLVQNYGFASIGSLSESVGTQRFGTAYRYRNPTTGRLDGDKLPIDLAANAESLGASVIRAADIAELVAALAGAQQHDGPVVISIETDPLVAAPDSNSWWDVPVAEVSELDTVNTAREQYTRGRALQRRYLSGGS